MSKTNDHSPPLAIADRDLVERSRSYVPPGGYVVATAPSVATTILGSCVAVCLYDPERGIGGLNHFLLPHWVEGAGASWRYGNAAIEGLISELVSAGARANALRAKVFGGACVLAAFGGRGGGHLGQRNVEVAREVLARHRIPIEAEGVGGDRGRKLIFQTDDGSAWVKLL